MKKTSILFLIVGLLLTSTISFSQEKKSFDSKEYALQGKTPYLLGSISLPGYPLKTAFLEDAKASKNRDCPLIQHIYNQKDTYKNWTITDSKGNKSKVTNMTMNVVGNITLLLIKAETFNVVLRSSTAEILMLTENAFYFHDGNKNIIKLNKN